VTVDPRIHPMTRMVTDASGKKRRALAIDLRLNMNKNK
jgi:hypothetical protein